MPVRRWTPLAGALLLAACGGTPGVQGERCVDGPPGRVTHGALGYRATSSIVPGVPDTLWVEVAVTNWGDGPVTLEWGAMALRVQAYRDRSAPPVWDSQRETDPVSGRAVEYPSYGRTEAFSPGVTVVHREWRRVLPVPVFLGDSLSAGTYHLTTTLRVGRDSIRAEAGCIRLTAPAE